MGNTCYRLAEGYEGAAVVAVKTSCDRTDFHAAEHHCGEQNWVVDALSHDYDPAQVISERTEIYFREAGIAGEIAVFNEASYFGYCLSDIIASEYGYPALGAVRYCFLRQALFCHVADCEQELAVRDS